MGTHSFFFRDDYSEGCHPNILRALEDTSLTQQIGYGADEYTAEAKQLIEALMPERAADIHFVSGGTQANLLVIGAALKPYESVISELTKDYLFHTWQSVDEQDAAVRLVTSWATPEAACEQFLESLKRLS